ncbi:MAG: tRNA threonylcarbamoyladenosine dehydratase [Candidatus Cloacimonetes bacterium]|nr:tRNA threonylcarbamoyladenosine dehydratase [Candidatus Cloacimonadota bacterium]
MLDQDVRTQVLIGEANLARLHQTRVCIVGLGGVGSSAAEALARAGICLFTLIDFDRINPTNLNRQIIALHSTIGQTKTDVLKERILDINPDANVICHNEFCAIENRPNLIRDQDYILDAIDSLGPKVGLIEYAVQNSFRIITVMGAGNRLDPSQIRISDISETVNCPLAKRVRKFLRRRGIKSGIPCVYSMEPAHIPEELEDEPDEMVIHRGRKRKTVGSISYMPVIMGMYTASWIIRDLISVK